MSRNSLFHLFRDCWEEFRQEVHAYCTCSHTMQHGVTPDIGAMKLARNAVWSIYISSNLRVEHIFKGVCDRLENLYITGGLRPLYYHPPLLRIDHYIGSDMNVAHRHSEKRILGMFSFKMLHKWMLAACSILVFEATHYTLVHALCLALAWGTVRGKPSRMKPMRHSGFEMLSSMRPTTRSSETRPPASIAFFACTTGNLMCD